MNHPYKHILIEKNKPDIIYHSIGYSIVDYAFILAERLLNIPSFGYADSSVTDSFAFEISLRFRLTVFKEYVRQFFEKKTVGKNS